MNYRADFHAPFSFVGTDIAEISNDNWQVGNPPKSYFQMTYVENYGFLINLYSDEKDPVMEYHHAGDPAYKDSCLEFFANFDPDNSDKYMNFEFSAGGAMLFGAGESRIGRTELTDFYKNADVTVSVHEDRWDVMAFIPKEIIFSVYGELKFKPGYTFKANVYKCCEKEGREHFVSWSPIVSEKPDFHTPEQFGFVTLDKSIENI